MAMPTDSTGAEAAPGGARLAELEQRNAELRVLYETIRDLTTTLSVREVLDRLLRRVLAHLDAEIGSILLIGPDERLRIMVARGLPTAVVEDASIAVGEGISGWVAATGESLLVQDVESDPRFHRHNNERYYTASFISAPLVHVGAVRGVINVNNKRDRAIFREGDLQLLEALAGHASAALANAHRYEAVLERAQRDSLTGLANHGHMWATLEVEFERADRHARPLSFAMIDIDHFKDFNDRFGHLVGDEALCAVARVLESNSRCHDVVARYGGEEFAVILPETDLDGAREYAEKMRRAVEREGVGPASSGALTVSVGVASAGAGASSCQQLAALADARLYRAKQAGRNQICVSDD
jgi:diguanylate cyclase (GGDEF)-like protein